MKFDILTLFPSMFAGPFSESIIQRAVDRGIFEIGLHNIRDYASGRHKVTDDYPYGGGSGMVMKVEPLAACIEAVRSCNQQAKVVLTTPQGRAFNETMARNMSTEKGLIIICGRYEGVDERVKELFVDYEISLGDYILTGGELAAMVMVDAVARFLPGVLGSEESAECDTFSDGLLEYPQYTRPPEFRGLIVPPVLLSGNHAEIARWRRRQALERTYLSRPDLLSSADLSEDEIQFLREFAGKKN
jgi:tRNA (guanine37-N1)-methyltransferase